MHRILLVEDETEILKIVKQFLERNGFDVIAASTGRKAVDIVASGEKVDLAVLDVKMPGMNGLDCMKAIRKIKPSLPAFFLTGSIDRAKYMEDLETLGVDPEDVFQKPVDLYELVGRIKERLYG